MRMPQKSHPKHDLIGRTFGRLHVMGLAATRPPNRNRWWLCRCECGKQVEVRTDQLVRDVARSCGCLHQDQRRAMMKGNERNLQHGHARAPQHTAEYNTWQAMRQRCLNPNYHHYADYGGRNITFCKRWNTFDNFFADMGPKPSPQHSLDRIDNNGNYNKRNCRWATPAEQAMNRRNTKHGLH